jgi:hypothetical protein
MTLVSGALLFLGLFPVRKSLMKRTWLTPGFTLFLKLADGKALKIVKAILELQLPVGALCGDPAARNVTRNASKFVTSKNQIFSQSNSVQ